jgi:hypothetical protein
VLNATAKKEGPERYSSKSLSTVAPTTNLIPNSAPDQLSGGNPF